MTPPPFDLAQVLGESIALREQAEGYARAYLEGVHHRPVAPDSEALASLEGFREALPAEGVAPPAVLKQLHRLGSPATTAQGGGRFFGMVNGGALPITLAARLLADSWDQNGAVAAVAPPIAALEAVVEGWLQQLFGLPNTVAASFLSGSSLALVTGLAAGRWRLLQRQGYDVNAKGLTGAPPLRVVAGAHLHAAALKALALLGFGRDQIEWVPVDDQGRLHWEALPALDDRTLLLLQAGNVNSGAFDPFHLLVADARAAGAWVHVDGAFGLWAAAAPQLAALTAGHEQAHSWSVDAHKTLNVPYDSGIALCADPEALFAALGAEGAYLPSGTAGVLGLNRDGLRYGPEMSRRGRVVELWAALKSLGSEGVAQLVSQLHERARQFRDALGDAGFPVLNDVVFNQVLVDVGPDADAFAAALRESGEAWAGASRWFDQPVLRLSVCSWVTSKDDIARTVQAMVRCRKAQAQDKA